MPLRTRNQFVVKAYSTERTHVIPIYVHVRECDLAHFHSQEGQGVNIAQTLLALLDGDAPFQALIHELDNVRMMDELIKTKSTTLFHITTSPDLQVQWQLQDHAHSLVNILQRTHKKREEYFVQKPSANSKPNGNGTGSGQTENGQQEEEEYLGGMLRPLPARKAAVAVWIYPPHVFIPPTGDRIPANPSCTIDFFHPDPA